MSDILCSILPGSFGDVGLIELNRLKALNALTHEMIVEMRAQLLEWQVASNIKAVLVRSNSEKAFCAGGDVVQLHAGDKSNIDDGMAFFKEEYLLNCLIRAYDKPYICLLNGLTIGGGVGISLHGQYPIATENFSFAMPETGIGFFPDVGGGYLLSRCHGSLGVYLGLTGKRIGRADAMLSGLIHHTIDSENQASFVQAILDADLNEHSYDTITALLLNNNKEDSNLSDLAKHQDEINQVFSLSDVGAMITKLCDMNSEWSQKTLSILQCKSPTALKVTLEQLKRVEGLSMEQTMQVEFVMASHFMKNSDFGEGVRALLVDKDKSPKWQPSSLEAVSNEMVNKYFIDPDKAYQLQSLPM